MWKRYGSHVCEVKRRDWSYHKPLILHDCFHPFLWVCVDDRSLEQGGGDGRWYNQCQVPTSHLIPHLLLPYSTFSVLQKIPILLKEKLDSMHNKSVTKLVPANISLFFHLALGRYLKQIYRFFSLIQTNQIISYSMPGFKNVNSLLFYCTQEYVGKIINWSFSMNTKAGQ